MFCKSFQVWFHSVIYLRIFLFFYFFTAFRLKSIPNSMDLHWDQRWLTKMNEHSVMHNCALMKVNWTCKWASIKVPRNLDMEDSATLVTCKLFRPVAHPNSFEHFQHLRIQLPYLIPFKVKYVRLIRKTTN